MNLGKCCCCLTEKGVRNVLMLHYKAPIPGHGWGCLVCHLPNDGAVAVVCDRCLDKLSGFKDGPIAGLLYACRGYPSEDGRVHIAEICKSEHRASENPAFSSESDCSEADEAKFVNGIRMEILDETARIAEEPAMTKTEFLARLAALRGSLQPPNP